MPKSTKLGNIKLYWPQRCLMGQFKAKNINLEIQLAIT